MDALKNSYRPNVVHLFSEYKGVYGRKPLADIAKRIAEFQKNRLGMDIKVLMKNAPGMALEGFKTVKNPDGKTLPGLLTRTIEGVPVYVIGKSSPYANKYIMPNLEEYDAFARGFLKYFKEKDLGDVNILHAHDDMGFALKYISESDDYNFRNVLSIHDPDDHVLLDTGKMSAHRKVCGTLEGLFYSDAATIWGDSHYKYLTEGKHRDLIRHLPISAPEIIETDWEAWKDSGSIPEPAIEALSKVYLEILHGKALEFSINLKRRGLIPDNILISITERKPWLDPRGEIIRRDLAKAMGLPPDTIKVASRGVKLNGEKITAYTDNIGGLIHMYEELFGEGNTYNPDGIYYALLSGGVGERLMNVGLAAAGMKGEVMMANKTLNQIMIEQAPIIATQLPNEGKGHVIVFGNDNYIIPYGPLMVGRHLLADAKQKICLIAKPVRIENLQKGEDVDFLKNYGVMIIDAETGDIKEFYEKKKTVDGKFDHKFMQDRLAQPGNGGDKVYLNTFYFTMTLEIAKLFYEKYSQKTIKSDLRESFHETYGLDLSKRFTEAAITQKEAWMNRWEHDKWDKDKKIKDVFVRHDWESVWEAAHEIVNAANGIGVINIGEKGKFSDVGTIPELYGLYRGLISSDHKERAHMREAMGLSNKNIDRSYIAGVTTISGEDITKKEDILINHSVFAEGGKIGKNCIVINSFFEEYVEIPSNSIVIGSHLHHVQTLYPEGMNGDKLMYGVHMNPLETLFFSNEVATASMFFHDGTVKTGQFPIFLTGQEDEKDLDGRHKIDPIFEFYSYNGDMKNQPIRGIGLAPAKSETKQLYSHANTQKAFANLMSMIDKKLRSHNIST
jgi:hypothetical protein